MNAPGIDVTVMTGNYLPFGKVPDYQSCTLTWQHMGVGTGALVVDEDDPVAPLLLSCASGAVVPVIASVNGVRWTGRVASATLDRKGPIGTGTVTATLVDDWVWLQTLLASQNGANPSLLNMPQYDTRTGPAATVAAAYINAAAVRYPAPVAAVAPAVDGTPSVTLNARMQSLAALLTDPLSAANLKMPARLWLPGDPGIAGLPTLNAPTVVFFPQEIAAKPWLRWTDTLGAFSEVTVTATAPKAYRMILGLDGQDAARVYDVYTDNGAQAALGTYALPEGYADATDAVYGPQSQARAVQELEKVAGSSAASVSVIDGVPWHFPADYAVSDIATASIAGVTLQERITQVTATDDRANGLSFTPLLGDPKVTARSEELIVLAVSDIATQLRTLQTRR